MASNTSAALKTTFVLPAVLAGISAALASVFAKLFSDARTSSFAKLICERTFYILHNSSNEVIDGPLPSYNSFEEQSRFVGRRLADMVSYACSPEEESHNSEPRITLIVRILCFGLIFVANASMWSLFTRALNASQNSVPVVIVNSATNFIMTAILGKIIFGEPLSLTWYLGASLIVAGTVISSRPHGSTRVVHEKKD